MMTEDITSDKMNNTRLRNALLALNKVSNIEFGVNSWEFGHKGKTQYGLMKKSKSGTMEIVLEAGYSKREIYYHIQGYLIVSRLVNSNNIKAPIDKMAKAREARANKNK